AAKAFIGVIRVYPGATSLPASIARDSQGYLLTGADAVASGRWPRKDREPCPLETTLPGVFFFSSRRRHTRCYRDWSSDVCSSDLVPWNRPDFEGPEIHHLHFHRIHLRRALCCRRRKIRIPGHARSVFPR